LAEATDRDVDDLWRNRAHRLLSNTEAVGHPGPEILHEDIGVRGQPQQGLSRGLLLEVEHDRALVAVVVQERGRETAAPVAAGPPRCARPAVDTPPGVCPPWRRRPRAPKGSPPGAPPPHSTSDRSPYIR